MSKRGIVAVLVVLGVGVVGVGLWAFEPWRAFTSSEVDEALPAVDRASTTAPPAGSSTPGQEPTVEATGEPEVEAVPDVVTLGQGAFEDAEHDTSGTALVLELADGRRFVRLEQLSSSDGPDLHVWLTDQPSGGSWGSYDDGRYLRLGELKATNGNQNYEIPADADISAMTSVVIWCDRFNVAFGTAPVRLG